MLRLSLAAVLLFADPSSVADVSQAATAGSVVVESTEQSTVALMRVQTTGRLFAGLGPAQDKRGRLIGHVELGRNGGSATTPAVLAVSAERGSVVFTAPATGPEIAVRMPGAASVVRGHALQLVRDREGGAMRVVRLK